MDKKWLPLNRVIEAINKMSPHTWTRDWDLKYIDLRIDTRDKHCLVAGRDGEVEVTIEKIEDAIKKSGDKFPILTQQYESQCQLIEKMREITLMGFLDWFIVYRKTDSKLEDSLFTVLEAYIKEGRK